MLFTGDQIKGKEAAEIGLVLKSVPLKELDEYVENLAARMASVPVNQLAMQKMIINQAMESSGLMEMQRMSTLFDGISRHSPEGLEFKRRVDEVGWKKAVAERDEGTYDWTRKKKI